MVAGLSPLAIVTLLSALVTTGIAAYTWRYSDKPGAKMFVGMQVGATIWSISYALALMTFDLQLNLAFEMGAWIGRLIIPVSWLVFALEYTGRRDLVTKPVVAVLAWNPGLTIGLLATYESHQLMWSGYHLTRVAGAAVPTYANGPWLVWQTVYGYVLISAGLFILFDMLYEQEKLYRGQALALIVAAAIPTIANLAWLFKLGPVHSLDLTPVAFSVSGLVMWYGLFRQDLFGMVPATRREGQKVALDYFDDGVVVIDDERRIIDVNATVLDIFDCDASSVLGEPIQVLLPDAGLDLTTDQTLVEADGRKFELTTTPIRDQRDRVIGRSLLFHDVTERVRRKQLLSVLNRVLRHNLRNEMNVVQGYAEMLDEREAGTNSEYASLILDRTERLIELGDKARDLERIITEDDRTPSRFRVGELVREIASQALERYPNGQVEFDVPEDLWMETDPEIIETVLANVIENSFEHTDKARPTVSVAVSRADTAMEIVVADDGPGIPDQELAILDAEEETPLEHSSGLGLWLVSWSVTALGGEISFEEKEPCGTVVRIRLPVLDAEPPVFDPPPA